MTGLLLSLGEPELDAASTKVGLSWLLVTVSGTSPPKIASLSRPLMSLLAVERLASSRVLLGRGGRSGKVGNDGDVGILGNSGIDSIV